MPTVQTERTEVTVVSLVAPRTGRCLGQANTKRERTSGNVAWNTHTSAVGGEESKQRKIELSGGPWKGVIRERRSMSHDVCAGGQRTAQPEGGASQRPGVPRVSAVLHRAPHGPVSAVEERREQRDEHDPLCVLAEEEKEGEEEERDELAQPGERRLTHTARARRMGAFGSSALEQRVGLCSKDARAGVMRWKLGGRTRKFRRRGGVMVECGRAIRERIAPLCRVGAWRGAR